MPRIVLANGCFDPLHVGHLYHFEAAKKLGDYLVVSVTKDEFVNKGEGRPVFNQRERRNMVAALRCVDEVILVESSLEALKRVRPQVFVKGSEYRGKISDADFQYCQQNEIELAFTKTPVFSSTAILKHYESRRG